MHRLLQGVQRQIRAALSATPGDAILHNSLGNALAADPDCAPAWQGLVDCDAMTAEDAHAVRERVEADRIGADDRAALHFALGRWHEQHGAYDEAFAEYRRGNDLVAAQRCFDARELARLTDRIIDVFAPERLPLAPRTGAAGPIFIVGMPRSGTTLLEQMLAAHPAVSAGGEREDLRSLATRLPAVAGTEAPFPEGIAELDPTGLRGLADSYRAQVEAAFGSATRFTDKLPGNYLRIGMIRLLFPEARVLHCRRDPLDTCVSCFTTHFARGQSFTYGLDRLATAYREYERLMAYWRRVAPDDFLDVDYETLVAEPEAELRRILAYCDLEWHADCLRFHEGERSIHTASRWQARQPVYGTSVGRWRRFRDHLGPLLELRPGD